MIIVSACFCNINCKYSGLNNYNEYINELVSSGRAVPVCPEVLGGLSIPRTPAEIIENNNERKVITKDGEDVTENFINGAEKILIIAKAIEAKVAILKSKSPSCGCGKIYDGTFSNKLILGDGFTAKLLKENNIKVYNEENFENEWRNK